MKVSLNKPFLTMSSPHLQSPKQWALTATQFGSIPTDPNADPDVDDDYGDDSLDDYDRTGGATGGDEEESLLKHQRLFFINHVSKPVSYTRAMSQWNHGFAPRFGEHQPTHSRLSTLA
jgi:hypothetical protein